MKGVECMILGKNILKCRKKLGLSQEQLGEKIGVTRQTISNWELGETTPNIEQIKILSKILNISIDELLEMENKNLKKSKVETNKNNSNKTFKTIGTIIAIILFLFIVIITSTMFFSNYFQTTATAGGVETTCEYKNEIIKIGVWKEYKSGNLFLNTSSQEILNNFKAYNYSHEEKMLDDIVKYIENNNGKCNLTTENNIDN